MDFKYLSSPIEVGQLKLKNRMMMTAMHTLYPGEGGMPSDRFNEFYWRRAEGQTGLVVVGACRFDNKGARPSCMSLADDSMIKPWQSFTAGMRERNCPVAVQLYHAGRYLASDGVPDGKGAVAPSAVYTSFTRETPRAMTQEDIRNVIAAWAEGARRAREAGFDAVEISASAGYLMTQFLSPLTNIREDEYGGSFENRCRFPLEVIRAVRKAVGDDYTLLLRWSGHTLVPGAGGSQEALDFVKLLKNEGIDLLDMTGGWHESRTPQLTEEMPFAAMKYLAEQTRKEVDITVSMANRMSNPQDAETAIAVGQTDMIAMGRALIAEPDYARFIMEGTPEKIRPCLSCNQGCLAGTFFEKPIRCFVNAAAGKEYKYKDQKTEKRKAILVVGGGPAGIEFALRASERGHKVTIWEEKDRLGGQLCLAIKMPQKMELEKFLNWYENRLKESDVSVVLNKKAEAEEIKNSNFDEVILANGRSYKPISVNITTDAVPVYSVYDFLENDLILPKRVAVIGGSFVGMESARKLLLDAAESAETIRWMLRYKVESDDKVKERICHSGRQVAIFEKGKMAAGYEPGIAWTVYGDLDAYGAEIHGKTEVKEINAEGILTEDGEWPCDAVIFCNGTNPDNVLYDNLKDALTVYQIGNAVRPGRGIDAIEKGCELAYTV